MNVIVFASRKGGSGKSTLTVHVASHAARRPRRCLLVDADPQGSASLWRNLRQIHEPPLRDGSRGVVDILRADPCLDGHIVAVRHDLEQRLGGGHRAADRGESDLVDHARLRRADLAAVDRVAGRGDPYLLVVELADHLGKLGTGIAADLLVDVEDLLVRLGNTRTRLGDVRFERGLAALHLDRGPLHLVQPVDRDELAIVELRERFSSNAT